jgi:hypothetical protein
MRQGHSRSDLLAYAAAGPAPLGEARLDALCRENDRKLGNLIGMRDEALRQAEAYSEIFEIGGSRHHHGHGGAAIDQRDSCFFSQHP